ncbi:MAG TPA: class I SAM-dependent methyltransferase [Chitinophagaceae bacterium]
MESLPCPLCGNSNTKHLFNKQDIAFNTCLKCRFIFSRPAINPNLANTLQDFEPAYLGYLKPQHHDKKNHDELIRKLGMIKDVGSSRILDIGCGSGKFIRYLRSKGYNAFGLEPSTALFNEFLKDDYFFFNEDVRTFINRDAPKIFDIIIVSDVLEHVAEPHPFMSAVLKLLARKGVLFISTPDTSSFFAQMLGKRWHYYNKYHLSLYSRKNLNELTARYGLRHVVSGYLSRYQSLNYLFQYGLNFIFHSPRTLPEHFKNINLPINLRDNMYSIHLNEG